MGKFQVKADMSSAMAGLQKLGDLKESLARRMGVSGGVVLRDEAKKNADRGSDAVVNSRAKGSTGIGSREAGALAAAIYLAFDTDASNEKQVVYNVSWNQKDAWWGKMVEFGYQMDHVVVMDKHGEFLTLPDKNGKKGKGGGLKWADVVNKSPTAKGPHWVAAQPFLGPAYDTKLAQARRDMIKRGKEELPKLLRGE